MPPVFSKLSVVLVCLFLAGMDTRTASAQTAASDPAETADLPGFGVWGPAYRLRNVPDSMRLVVRASGDRAAATVGSLSRSASEILVLNCFPEIVPLDFEDASPEAKREMLGGVWCRIDHYGMTGFVPGIYLDPILGR